MEIFSFVGFFLGLYAAIELTVPIATKFVAGSDYFQMITIGIFVILFIGVIVLMNFVGKALKKVVNFTFLGFFDKIFGALAAAFRMAFVLSVLLWVFDSVGFRLPEDIVGESLIYSHLKVLGPKVFEGISTIVPFIRDMMNSLENLHSDSKSVFTFL